jgi:hypothetical protein
MAKSERFVRYAKKCGLSVRKSNNVWKENEILFKRCMYYFKSRFTRKSSKSVSGCSVVHFTSTKKPFTNSSSDQRNLACRPYMDSILLLLMR